MPLFDNTNDIILIIGSLSGSICAIIAAIRLSRCEYVSICKGLFTIKRSIQNKNNLPTTEIRQNKSPIQGEIITRIPSTDTLQLNNDDCVEV